MRPRIVLSNTPVLMLFLMVTLPLSAAELPGVQLSPVEQSSIVEEVRLNGTVNAMRNARLSPSVPGLVEAVHAEPGDRVESGDELIHLDDELERHMLSSARAETQEARALLADAERRLSEARSVGAGRNIAATEISARESAVETSKAMLLRLQAEEARQLALLSRHSVKAPFSGVVTARHSDLGEWVTPGDPLMDLVDSSDLRLDFQVPQDYFALIGEGSSVMVEPSSSSGGAEAMAASIDAVVPVTDPQARTFLLRTKVPEQLQLLPGMSATAMLRVDSGKAGLTVPRDAINRYPEGRTTVWIAEAEGEDVFVVREQRVELGASFAERVVIRDGLTGEEQIVSRGNESLNNDMKVRLSRWAAE
ncbi:efflux RND transporter periplasmic adaptor subunit [Allohahella marinimesophila]|uniref:Efflux RND transporter periplasmic adaptor subunit n=1 Tax=Allohahella marinimesophila TaxID=1054972 RepID=A0ABP7PJW1_9GAMM